MHMCATTYSYVRHTGPMTYSSMLYGQAKSSQDVWQYGVPHKNGGRACVCMCWVVCVNMNPHICCVCCGCVLCCVHEYGAPYSFCGVYESSLDVRQYGAPRKNGNSYMKIGTWRPTSPLTSPQGICIYIYIHVCSMNKSYLDPSICVT